MIDAFIALGANLNDPCQQLSDAVASLKELPNSEWGAVSPFYSSSPMGPQDQPDYVNAVAHIRTELSAHQLLDELQKIELAQGRIRKEERWGPRTLDLDLLLFGQQVIQDERLIVPHYGMKERAFVLVPLFDIAPTIVMPDGTAISELFAQCDKTQLFRIEN